MLRKAGTTLVRPARGVVAGRRARRQPLPWPAGRVVVLRHVLGERTWCALPVTVLADEPYLLVLRIAAGTRWWAAHRPDGRRAHSYHAGWRLAPARWLGHDCTYLVEPARWCAVGLMSTRGVLAKYYLNAQRPVRRRPWGFDTMDLELDLELAPDAAVPHWKDVDRFARLRVDGALAEPAVRRIWQDVRACRGLVDTPEWRRAALRWLTVPGRPADLAEVLGHHPVPGLPDDAERRRP